VLPVSLYFLLPMSIDRTGAFSLVRFFGQAKK
jgi:hypothetical protein